MIQVLHPIISKYDSARLCYLRHMIVMLLQSQDPICKSRRKTVFQVISWLLLENMTFYHNSYISPFKFLEEVFSPVNFLKEVFSPVKFLEEVFKVMLKKASTRESLLLDRICGTTTVAIILLGEVSKAHCT